MEWTPGSAISLPRDRLATRTTYPRGVALSTASMSDRSRLLLRSVVALLGGAIAGSRIIDAIRAWHEWRSWLARDQSGAEAYRGFFFVSSAIAILSICLAALLWYLLRPAQRGPGDMWR
jgi:hypothetical protein